MNTVASFFTKLVNRWLPDPLVIAIFLTAFSIVIAGIFGEGSPADIVQYWGDGFWDLLAFTMQMTVILLAGYMLALTPPVDRLLEWLAGRVSNPRVAIVLITLVGGIGSWLNWGFGLVAGGIVAQKVALRVKGLHYPLAIAAGFSGFALYGIGLSGSVPLLLATPDHFMEDKVGIIPLSETVFSPYLIAITVATVILLPIFNAFMHPRNPQEIKEIDPNRVVKAESNSPAVKRTIADKINDSPIIGVSTGLVGMLYIILYFLGGGSLTLNTVNFVFLMLGLMLFARPRAYLSALNHAVQTVSGIIIQYPFYAGIMAILVGSGMIVKFSNLFADISTAATLPLWSFISGGIINILVPSGGGQFAVQGPVMIEAAQTLGADFAATSVAVQIGDQWTNMVQPFWLLPVLAISGLKIRDVMGYMVMVLIFLAVIFASAVVWWGFATA